VKRFYFQTKSEQFHFSSHPARQQHQQH